jgi:hypothetical protein
VQLRANDSKLKDKLYQASRERDTLQQKNQEKDEELKLCKSQNQDLQHLLQEKTSQLEYEQNVHRDKVESFQSQLQQSEETRTALLEQYEMIKVDKNTKTEEYECSQKELREAHCQLDQANTEIKRLQKAHDKIAKSQSKGNKSNDKGKGKDKKKKDPVPKEEEVDGTTTQIANVPKSSVVDQEVLVTPDRSQHIETFSPLKEFESPEGQKALRLLNLKGKVRQVTKDGQSKVTKQYSKKLLSSQSLPALTKYIQVQDRKHHQQRASTSPLGKPKAIPEAHELFIKPDDIHNTTTIGDAVAIQMEDSQMDFEVTQTCFQMETNMIADSLGTNVESILSKVEETWDASNLELSQMNSLSTYESWEAPNIKYFLGYREQVQKDMDDDFEEEHRVVIIDATMFLEKSVVTITKKDKINDEKLAQKLQNLTADQRKEIGGNRGISSMFPDRTVDLSPSCKTDFASDRKSDPVISCKVDFEPGLKPSVIPNHNNDPIITYSEMGPSKKRRAEAESRSQKANPLKNHQRSDTQPATTASKVTQTSVSKDSPTEKENAAAAILQQMSQLSTRRRPVPPPRGANTVQGFQMLVPSSSLSLQSGPENNRTPTKSSKSTAHAPNGNQDSQTEKKI